MHLIFHVTSPGHLIEGSCEFTGGSSLRYVTILINLVTIIIVIVEMFVTWPLVNTCLKGDMNL